MFPPVHLDFTGSAAQFAECMFQGCMFDAPELGFSRIAKDFRYGTPFTSLDTVVQIFKDPIQSLPEGAAHGAFPGSHESDQENRVARNPFRNRGQLISRHTSALPSGNGLARTLLQKVAARSRPLSCLARSQQLEARS